MTISLPSSARYVIIGGGVIGTSIAYHLTLAGETDVLLLEKSSLTEGATWHAAGLVGQFRSQQNLMSLMNDSVQLFDGLAEATGQDPGWRKFGSLRLAQSEDRWKELLKSYSAAQAVGFEMQMLTPREAGDVYPLLETDDLVGAAFIPADGYIDPNSLTQAYARGIRANGGKIIEGVMVTDLRRERDRITVETAVIFRKRHGRPAQFRESTPHIRAESCFARRIFLASIKRVFIIDELFDAVGQHLLYFIE